MTKSNRRKMSDTRERSHTSLKPRVLSLSPSLSEKVFVGLTAFACAEALSKTLATIIPSTGAALHAQRIAPGVSVGGVGLGMRASGSQMGNAVIVGGLLSAIKNYI